jgi:hypothetical protein
MALKIAPAEKFLLNVQPELRQATQRPKWHDFDNNLYKMALNIAPGKNHCSLLSFFGHITRHAITHKYIWLVRARATAILGKGEGKGKDEGKGEGKGKSKRKGEGEGNIRRERGQGQGR